MQSVADGPKSLIRAVTRRDIMAMLATREMTVSEVAARFEMTRPAIAKHLGILREGGLITTEIRGRERINRLTPETLKPVSDWLEFYSQFWDDKLEKLKAAVEKDEDDE